MRPPSAFWCQSVTEPVTTPLRSEKECHELGDLGDLAEW
jgi:hypothetical protein